MPVHVLEPRDMNPALTVLFLHGGAYVMNATRPHWRFLASLVENTGCRVVAPDYPLVPASCYADAYPLLKGLYRHLVADAPSAPLLLMGDSAGGGLALGLAMAVRDEGQALPAGILLLSPWLDVTMSNHHIDEIDPHDPFLNVEGLKRAGLAWARGANPRKPWISPIYGVLAGLPPLHLFIGTKDVLVADARRFRGLCIASGADLCFYEFENMVHDWMLLDFKEAKMAMEQIAGILAGIVEKNS